MKPTLGIRSTVCAIRAARSPPPKCSAISARTGEIAKKRPMLAPPSISAGSLSQLLRAAYASPLFSEFESALPIVAIDGTLKRRFNGSPLVGSAHLKTGTLRDVSALAGYVYTATGRRIAFVMLVNHEHAKRALEAQQQLLEWVWHDVPAAVAPQP